MKHQIRKIRCLSYQKIIVIITLMARLISTIEIVRRKWEHQNFISHGGLVTDAAGDDKP